MSKYFSPTDCAFYDEDVHEEFQIPGDAREISDEEWQDLLSAQSQGKQIVAGTHGGPIAIERAPPPVDVLALRDRALADSDWLVARHRDEVEIDPSRTTLSSEQYTLLQAWRRALRNLSSLPDFPNVSLPERPV